MTWLIACERSGRIRDAMIVDGFKCIPIPGFPRYLAREDGEVMSLCRKNPFVMKRRPHRSGYVLISLANWKGEIITTVSHRVIALAFHGNPEGLPCVRHLDGDKQNNRPENLAFGTYQENEKDKINHGRKVYGAGKMKLDSASRARAIEMFRDGWSRVEIANHFAVNRSTISRLLSGRTWQSKWKVIEKDISG